MKKTMLLLPLLLLSLNGAAVPSTAASTALAQEKSGFENQIIITGAYRTKVYAERQMKRLEESMNSDPQIAALQKESGFSYLVKHSGNYYLVAIEPLNGEKTIERVLASAKKIFKDAYVHIRQSQSAQADDLMEAPAENTALSVTGTAGQDDAEAETMSASEKAEETVAEAVMPETDAPEIEEEVQVSAEVQTPAPVQALQPSAAKEVTNSPTAKSGIMATLLASDELLLYGGAGGVVAVLLVLMLLLRKKKEKPLREAAEAAVDKEKATHAAEAPKAAEAPHEAEPEVVPQEMPAHEEPTEAPAEVMPEVPAEPETAVEEKPSAVHEMPKAVQTGVDLTSPRKKREPRADRGKISKDDFSEFSGERLLVAEDNLINQKVISKMLADSGIEVVIANDGQEALDILARDSDFRLILMDAHMPIVDGFEATRTIRANPDYDHIAIAALSGDVAADDIRKMQEAGMEAQLEKPLRLEALYDVMYSYFKFEDEESEDDEAEEAAESEIEETFELHTGAGLSISGGDEELYREILNEFAQMYANSDQLLNTQLMESDFTAANALLLDVVGLAANIGADQLAEAAGKLRASLREGNESEYMELYDSYKQHLHALLKDIENIE